MTVKCGGNVLSDDSVVVELNGRKRYAEAGESVGALVQHPHCALKPIRKHGA